MSKQNEQIQILLEKSKAAASEITKPLKEIGDGSMLDGVKNFYQYALNEGEKTGVIKGCLATVIIGGVCILGYKGVKFIKQKHEYNKHHKQMGEDIIHALNENLIVNESSDNTEESKFESIENAK